MAELFERHSKLLILRIDLYFRPNQKEWADTAAAGRSIRSFMRALRDGRVLPDMAGWACRIENGFRRGIHVHLLVAMDGHKHREAATWSKAVGAAWVTKYSAGHGSYFNCYARKDWYKFNGLVCLCAARRRTKSMSCAGLGTPDAVWRSGTNRMRLS